MPTDRLDDRLDVPLAADLVTDVAALYDRLGRLSRQLDPSEEVDELTTLLPYTERIADVTRLVARLLDCLVPNGVDLSELLPVLTGYAAQLSGGRAKEGTVGSLLVVAAGMDARAPLMVRDLFLLDAGEVAAVSEELAASTFAAAVVTLRVVTEYVHGCFGIGQLSRGDVLRELLAGFGRG